MSADDDNEAALEAADRDLDALCEAWVWWRRENRLYEPAPGAHLLAAERYAARMPGSVRALEAPTVAHRPGSLAAFHVAYTCQPDALDKQVFDLYYIARVKPVKAAAAFLCIGHRQFYRVLEAFRRRLDASARAFESNTLATADGEILPLFPISGTVEIKREYRWIATGQPSRR